MQAHRCIREIGSWNETRGISETDAGVAFGVTFRSWLEFCSLKRDLLSTAFSMSFTIMVGYVEIIRIFCAENGVAKVSNSKV